MCPRCGGLERHRLVWLYFARRTDLFDGRSKRVLHIAPELVHLELAQDYMMSRDELRRYRRGWLKVPKGSPGSIGRPTLATAAKGKALYDRIRSRISERVFLAPAPTS